MSEQPTARWGDGVRLLVPQMRTLSFRYDGPGEIPEDAHIDYEWGLGVHRFGPLTIGVEFSVSVRLTDLAGQTTYRIGFELVEGSPESANPDTALRQLASRAAPVTLFPYMRETLSSAAMRCGVRFALPFQNVGALFTPEEVNLPEVDAED